MKPGVLRLGLARANVEIRSFVREKDTVLFTFSLPIVILVILGSIYRGTVAGTGVTAAQLFVGGMLAGGVASTSFGTLGAGIAMDRADGTLKRLWGTPMPRASYFLGKVILVVAASLAELVAVVGVGAALFDLPLPRDPVAWMTLAWVFLLGGTACALAGVALASLARTARSASALSTLALLMLMFASGIYVIPVSNLPGPLVGLGSLFPLKWMAQGMRSAFLPDALTRLEVAGAWEHGRIALVLGAWSIGGLVLCLATFRWRSRHEQ